MKQLKIGKSNIVASELSLGCFRIGQMSDVEVDTLVKKSLELGINFFDHANIYGGGKCEELFGKFLKNNPKVRQNIFIQSKCGIRQGQFDFSEQHILESVDGSLRRLGIDSLDVLLLHRPDALVEPEKVASAFNKLHSSGKVKHFGVSNHKPSQIELLKKALTQPLITNQLQYSIASAGMVDQGLNVNMENNLSVDHDESVLDYCRLNDVTVQTWSSLQFGFFEGVFIGHEKFPALNKCLNELAEKYKATPTAVAIAWVYRHPAKMQVISGTTKPDRLAEMALASTFTLTRKEWYDLYLATGKKLP